MRHRPLSLVLALLVLASQMAVAIHQPYHVEESVSSCGDRSAHVCATTPEDEAGNCLLCRAAADGLDAARASSVGFVPVLQSAAPAERSLAEPAPVLSASAPRAPPVG